jgi:hypothetical protein
MNTVITKEVLTHVAAQVAAAALTGAVIAISKVDFSSLGVYAPLVVAAVQGVAATVTAIAHEIARK